MGTIKIIVVVVVVVVFGLKTGIDFALHFGLGSGMVFEGTT